MQRNLWNKRINKHIWNIRIKKGGKIKGPLKTSQHTVNDSLLKNKNIDFNLRIKHAEAAKKHITFYNNKKDIACF